jgi:DNA-binding XRE family transcriptional regulator
MFVRFWAKVDKNGPIHPVLKTRCWIWLGSISSNGYGQFWLNGKAVRVHRVVWFLTHSEWPKAHCLHHCDNPPCCNPAHLFEGTVQDNHADMVRKGRSTLGSKNGAAKLTEVKAAQIRKMYASGNFTQVKLAELYDVSQTTVSDIVLNRHW